MGALRPRSGPVAAIREVWVARPPRPDRRWPAIAGALTLLAAMVAGLIFRAWLAEYWLAALLVGLAVVAFLFWAVGLDVLTYHIEHRDHDLWISDGRRRLHIWRHNEVEVNKALRAINRARDL
ncbi:DUF6232 family protein [Luedemannella flava]